MKGAGRCTRCRRHACGQVGGRCVRVPALPRSRPRGRPGNKSTYSRRPIRVECPRWEGSPPAVEQLRPGGVRVARLRWDGGKKGGARGSDGVVRVVLASVLAARAERLGSGLWQFPSRVPAVVQLPARSGTAPTGRRPSHAPAVERGKGHGGGDGVVRAVLASVLAARVEAARLGPLAVSESSARGGTAPRPQRNGSDRTASGSRACGGTGKKTRGSDGVVRVVLAFVLAARVEAARLGPLAVSESSARGGTAPRPQWNGSDRTACGSRACGGTGKGGTRGSVELVKKMIALVRPLEQFIRVFYSC
jgi:hypothetical protein